MARVGKVMEVGHRLGGGVRGYCFISPRIPGIDDVHSYWCRAERIAWGGVLLLDWVVLYMNACTYDAKHVVLVLSPTTVLFGVLVLGFG